MEICPLRGVEIMRPHKLAYLICNSFRRTPETPNKFRVVMFMKSPVDDHDYSEFGTRLLGSWGKNVRTPESTDLKDISPASFMILGRI
jgi:hypothetical protein